ncbi:MAG: hypothetical protein OXI43_22925 [Candidatus Poribacteria bacterium]|nr:hypothetical protein [Candidatus Poribacteria bacterium]
MGSTRKGKHIVLNVDEEKASITLGDAAIGSYIIRAKDDVIENRVVYGKHANPDSSVGISVGKDNVLIQAGSKVGNIFFNLHHDDNTNGVVLATGKNGNVIASKVGQDQELLTKE